MKWSYGIIIWIVGFIGVLVMMYGYMVFDKMGELLVLFWMWCNVIISVVVKELIEYF